MKYPYFLISLLFHTLILRGQDPLRPFPQHVHYAEGTIKPNHILQRQLDDSVRSFYRGWKERYINDDAGEGNYYVWVEGSVGNKQCVSEGQGYGMMILALMAGYDDSAKKTYNGLFHYYKSHPSRNSPHLMAWAQTKRFLDVDGTSATDGDMDIAYSLLLADAQWGSQGAIDYLGEARKMIADIMKEEINQITFSVLLSNAVEGLFRYAFFGFYACPF